MFCKCLLVPMDISWACVNLLPPPSFLSKSVSDIYGCMWTVVVSPFFLLELCQSWPLSCKVQCKLQQSPSESEKGFGCWKVVLMIPRPLCRSCRSWSRSYVYCEWGEFGVFLGRKGEKWELRTRGSISVFRQKVWREEGWELETEEVSTRWPEMRVIINTMNSGSKPKHSCP